MPRLEHRVAALEQRQPPVPRPAIMLNQGETQEDALKRLGHPPGTDALFIRLVGVKPRAWEGPRLQGLQTTHPDELQVPTPITTNPVE